MERVIIKHGRCKDYTATKTMWREILAKLFDDIPWMEAATQLKCSDNPLRNPLFDNKPWKFELGSEQYTDAMHKKFGQDYKQECMEWMKAKEVLCMCVSQLSEKERGWLFDALGEKYCLSCGAEKTCNCQRDE